MVEIAQQTCVQFFKNIISTLKSRGHEVQVLSRERECTVELLNEYGIDHSVISKFTPGKYNLLTELLVRDYKIWKAGRSFQPDLVLTASIAGVHAAKLLRVPSLLQNDNGRSAGLLHRLMVPLATYVLTPDCQNEDYGSGHIKYPGYKELAYLHPANFTPDSSVLQELGIKAGERLFILRFTSLQACHDAGRKGMSYELKNRMIELLHTRGRVFISSEGVLPAEWEKFRLTLSPGKIHSALYYADLYAGDSGTMASESSVLGTPGIFMLSFSGTLYYLKELEERYGLLYQFRHNQEEECMALVRNLLDMKNLKAAWAEKRQIMLGDKVDVADYFVKKIETVSI